MRDPLRVLYLEANGIGTRIICVDTVLRGIFRYGNGARPPRPLRRYPKINLLFGELADFNARLSYVADWRDGFCASPRLKIELCNINNLVHYGRCLFDIRDYDMIVVSHAAAGDDMTVLTKSAHWLDRRRCPMIVFLGNEYDLLDEKIGFVRDTQAEFLCTQLPISTARYLYGELAHTRIVEMPHALNPRSYYPMGSAPRSTDVGFIGDLYWPFVGDRERTDLIEWFEAHGADFGLRCDIRKQRLSREEWNRFLNQCRAIIGAESGTYFLNQRGKLLDRARAYNLRENQGAGFDEVFDRFYRGVPREVSGKSISSRHFEPIGTKTGQILLEGEYNGILQPNLHYIAVKKDLSNVDEAIVRFRDEASRTRMAEETYDYVMSEHTYAHRIDRLLDLVLCSPETAAEQTAETQIEA